MMSVTNSDNLGNSGKPHADEVIVGKGELWEDAAQRETEAVSYPLSIK